MPSTLPLSRPPVATATTSFTSTTSTTSSASTSQTLASHTHRHAPWTYLHLTLHTAAAGEPSPDLDALTTRQHLTTALRQHLGAHGAAVPVDILKVAASDAWVRVPGADGPAVVAAVGAWVGVEEGERRTAWVVRGWGGWLGAVATGRGEGLFDLGD